MKCRKFKRRRGAKELLRRTRLGRRGRGGGGGGLID